MKTKEVKIIIENINFILDVDKALAANALTTFLPLEAGDVYIHPVNRINSFLLVNVTYDGGRTPLYQLLGRGTKANSGPFFTTVHTLGEIQDYLQKEGMIFYKNINEEINNLIPESEIPHW